MYQASSQKCEMGGGRQKDKSGGAASRTENRVPRIKAPRGVGFGEGVPHSPMGEESGEGAEVAVPPPQKFF